MGRRVKYPAEVRERAVRLVFEDSSERPGFFSQVEAKPRGRQPASNGLVDDLLERLSLAMSFLVDHSSNVVRGAFRGGFQPVDKLGRVCLQILTTAPNVDACFHELDGVGTVSGARRLELEVDELAR